MPSFGCLAATTAASTLVSPYVASTAPSAWRAILPVSSVRLRPPQSSWTRCISNIAIVFHGFRAGAKAMSKTARGCRSQNPCESKQHPAILPWPSGLPVMRTGIGPSLLNRQPLAARQTAEAFCDPPRNAQEFPRANFSAANTQPLNQLLVTPFIGTPQIVENLAPLRHELEQAPPRGVLLDVRFEVSGQAVDPLRKQRNLNFGRTGVLGLKGVSLNDFRLTRGRSRHRH